MNLLYIPIAIILSAFCYRIGGMSKESAKQHFPWFPQVLVKSWFRDVNCSLLTIGYALLFLPRVSWFWYLLAFAAQYAATTTYWDDKLPPKGVDKFWAHGLFIRLAFLFIAIPAGVWFSCIASAAVLALFMEVWCEISTDDFVEEYGRGASIQATLPLIHIGG